MAELDNEIKCAPEVGDLVFEKAASEREDPVNRLRKLVEGRIVDGLCVDAETSRERQRRE